MSDVPPESPYGSPPPPPPPPGGGNVPPPPSPPPGEYPPPPPGWQGYPPQAPPPPPPGPGGYPPPPPPPYGPPPGGGYQPPGPYPPGGGYPPGGYPGYSAAPSLDVGKAVSYGWSKFKEDPGTWILLMVVVAVGAAVVFVVSTILRAALSTGLLSLLLVSGITSILQSVVIVTLELPLYRAALAVTSGVRPTTDMLTNFDQLGPFFVTALLIGVMTGVGSFFCVLPGIALGFFSFLAPFFVLARQQEPVDAIKSSFKLISANVGPMALFAIVGFLLAVAGVVACLVGALVTGPIVIISAAYAFRVSQGEPVAP